MPGSRPRLTIWLGFLFALTTRKKEPVARGGGESSLRPILQRLSSRITFLAKFVFPWLGLGGFLCVAILSFTGALPGQSANGQILGWIALGAISFGLPLVFFVNLRLKAVRL